MLQRKPIKRKVVKRKNPDSDPSRVIDFNEEQLEEFYNDNIKVQIEYKYGSFKGRLIHRSSKYTIYFEDYENLDLADIDVIFSFQPDDIKKITRKNKNSIPIIALK